MSLAVRLESASTEFQKIQLELQNAVEARQRLDAQLNENELVKKARLVCLRPIATSADRRWCRSLRS